MNKKIFIMPIAICAMGLASCNKGWPTKTIDEADEIAKKIYASTEMTNPTGDLFKCGTESIFDKAYYKVGNAYEEESKQFIGCVDADAGYSKITVQVEEKSSSSSSKIENVMYDILKAGKDYQLSNIEYYGTSADCTVEQYTTGAKEKALKAYTDGYKDEEVTEEQFDTPYNLVKPMLNDVKTHVEGMSKNFEEQKKNADKGEFSYVFQSKDEKSLQLTLEAKLWGLKVSKVDSFAEPKVTKYDYNYSRIEISIENNIFTNYKFISEKNGTAKVSDSAEYRYEEKHESAYTLNLNKPAQDNVDLNNYYIEEKK